MLARELGERTDISSTVQTLERNGDLFPPEICRFHVSETLKCYSALVAIGRLSCYMVFGPHHVDVWYQGSKECILYFQLVYPNVFI